MFADELRRGAEASPRVGLPNLSAVLRKAYAAGRQRADLAVPRRDCGPSDNEADRKARAISAYSGSYPAALK
jgi:hypothetical protein